MINYFKITDDESYSDALFHVADLPGYGFAKAPKTVVKQWNETMDTFLAQATRLRVQALLLLIDSRHGMLQSDFDFLRKRMVPQQPPPSPLQQPQSNNIDVAANGEAEDVEGNNIEVEKEDEEENEPRTLPYHVVLTKADKVSISKLQHRVTETIALFDPEGPVQSTMQLPAPVSLHAVSSKKDYGIQTLRCHILDLLGELDDVATGI